ncbi:camp-binding domain-like protein [Tothia fuscella]|uniref:cAMP-dependent protein kinase regulatory subunit n=1 Tax=Tothia fuscella TaxID=1048955 RepID=A0A9P4NGC3_9PEZI|nr:camp-binding domain-like protein [Tothia fuscella]
MSSPPPQATTSDHLTSSNNSINDLSSTSSKQNSSSSTLHPTIATLPPQFEAEIENLLREATAQSPSDVIQFCANYFNKRLESERASSLQKSASASTSTASASASAGAHSTLFHKQQQQQQQGSTSSPSTNRNRGMADVNPFAAHPANAGAGMQRLEEEEENDHIASPTTGNFPRSANMSTSTSQPPKSSSSGASTSNTFGNFGGWGNSASGANTSDNTSSNTEQNSHTPTNYNLNRRTSVSAESLNPATSINDNWTPPSHKKTSEQHDRLKKAVSGNFLFTHLDEDQSAQVLGALVEKPIPAKGIKVIQQGDVGDYFYIVESGSFDIFVNKSGKLEAGPDGIGEKVASCGPGNSFGELALMYNAPRAATVVSTESSMLWALDRVTFRRILMDSAFQRRRMYENFLEEVPLLSSLKPYERSKIADALETQKYPAGSVIIREGDPGEAFFILESGTAEVFKKGVDKPINFVEKGGYFGELALLNDKPRAASVVAKTEVKLASLGKDGFQRLLGPVESIMRRNDPSRAPPEEPKHVDPSAEL